MKHLVLTRKYWAYDLSVLIVT